jgi:hypothetical protein
MRATLWNVGFPKTTSRLTGVDLQEAPDARAVPAAGGRAI